MNCLAPFLDVSGSVRHNSFIVNNKIFGLAKQRLVIRDFFEHFDEGNPYQCASLMELQEAIDKADPTILTTDAQWFSTWSWGGRTK